MRLLLSIFICSALAIAGVVYVWKDDLPATRESWEAKQVDLERQKAIAWQHVIVPEETEPATTFRDVIVKLRPAEVTIVTAWSEFAEHPAAPEEKPRRWAEGLLRQEFTEPLPMGARTVAAVLAGVRERVDWPAGIEPGRPPLLAKLSARQIGRLFPYEPPEHRDVTMLTRRWWGIDQRLWPPRYQPPGQWAAVNVNPRTMDLQEDASDAVLTDKQRAAIDQVIEMEHDSGLLTVKAEDRRTQLRRVDFNIAAVGDRQYMLGSSRHDEATSARIDDYVFARLRNALLIDLVTAAVAGAAMATLLWGLARLILKWRRRFDGGCPKCGYDVRMSPDRCPECGFELPATARTEPGKPAT